MLAARCFQAQNLPRIQTRFILRTREGQDILHPLTGKVLSYPSHMAALRGRAMIDCNAFIIQQEKSHV